MSRPLRVGIVNLMPRAERYEQMLVAALEAARVSSSGHALPPLHLVFIRLDAHRYASSDATHLRTRYVRYQEARSATLDRLLITGAPVEELPFAAVHYWDELTAIVRDAQETVRSTLGVCWGGMAIAALLGVGKVVLPKKLSGLRMGCGSLWTGSRDRSADPSESSAAMRA